MLIIGVILLVIGAFLLIAPTAGAPGIAPAAPLGWLLALVGLILIVVAVVDVGDADAAVLAMAVGGGGSQFDHLRARPDAGEDPAIAVAGPGKREPVILAFIVAAVPIVCAFILQVLDVTDALESALWLRTLLTGLGGVVGALAAAWARANVTPTAAPRLDDDTPLVPMVESEGV